MKKNKLSLRELNVKSFVISNEKEAETIKGGDIVSPYVSLIPGLGGVCLIAGVAEAAGTIAQATATIVKSQQGTDCAGATRRIAGCTDGTFPCNAACL